MERYERSGAVGGSARDHKLNVVSRGRSIAEESEEVREHGCGPPARNHPVNNPETIVDIENLHYYEPSQGHGLRHNPFNAIIAPRPIGWISSLSSQGQLNLAPYSF